MKKGKRVGVILMVLIVTVGLYSFGKKKEKTTFVEVTTVYGVMKFKLYNETPLHRDNFVKLTKEAFFDSLLFHRVINQFMIQGGDPDSKGAKPGAMLGNGGPNYDIDAEFVPSLYHKRGALAAAREGDAQNPLKRSSGSQFYIVQGRVFDSVQIANIQQNRIDKIRSSEMKTCLYDSANVVLLESYREALQRKDEVAGQVVIDSLDVMIAPVLEKYEYTPEQLEVYQTIGGTPHLDYSYTVFGEMVEGFDVLDSIAAVPTDKRDRPKEDVMMTVRIVKR